VLAVIAFNLTRAAATLTGPKLARATTATIRRTLITVPARVASSARQIILHLPRAVGGGVDPAVRPRLRATSPDDHLTTQPHRREPQRRGTP
jgi:hypothetical protein